MQELVLTGHKELWPNNENDAFFLGPHCFIYNDKYNFCSQDKFHLAPSPWKNAQDILAASLYIDKVYDRIIPKLSDIMNSLYGLSYSEKFWNAYIILWLHHWLGIVYDRYRRLEYVVENLKGKFMVKILDQYDPTVSDFWSFISRITEGHYHNLVIMTEIVNHARFDFLDCKKVSILPEVSVVTKKSSFKDSAIKFLLSSKEILKDRVNGFFTSSLFLGTVYGLSAADKISLQFQRDPIFLFKKRARIPVKILRVNRSGLNNVRLEFGAQNRFEKIVEEILLKHLPDSLLSVCKYTDEAQPKIKTWVGTDIYISQKKCCDISSVLEYGGRWISSQHGGVYGQSISFPVGKLEYETSGEFITWGWEHKHIYNANYRTLPSPMLSKLKKHTEREDSIIFVGTAMFAYLYRLSNYLTPEQIIGYMKNKVIFLNHLEEKVLQKIKYQPYPHDYGIKEREVVGKVLSGDQFLTGKKAIDLFRSARLVVIDHPSTGFLEALSINVPTILYWNPTHFTSCEAAAPYFDKLRTCGILYDSAQSAAEKINKIWPDVAGWWNNSDIQRAKDDFCFQFARAQVDWRHEWGKFVKNL